MVYVLLYHTLDLEDDDNQIADHPYPFGALIAALTFLLAFRANFAYNRYWEAVSAIHQMHSKWLDVGMDLAAFHLQSDRYKDKRPPAFGEHADLTDVNRHRERENETTLEELEEQLNSSMEDETRQSLRSRIRRRFSRRRRGDANDNNPTNAAMTATTKNSSINNPQPVLAMSKPKPRKKKYKSISRTTPTTTSATFTSVFASVFRMAPKLPSPLLTQDGSSTNLVVRTDSARHFDQAWKHGQPPLFLQEAAHLLSLLSAVGACVRTCVMRTLVYRKRCSVVVETTWIACILSLWTVLFLCLVIPWSTFDRWNDLQRLQQINSHVDVAQRFGAS